MADPEPGVIEDRGQGVVELVGRGAEEFTQAGLFASLENLALESGDLGGMGGSGGVEFPLEGGFTRAGRLGSRCLQIPSDHDPSRR